MASGRRMQVISNWSTLVEDFNASAKRFYDELEQAIARRQIPHLTASRVFWAESGVLSAEREYLRLERGTYRFDICAAPFGTGYFFSWWFTVRLPSPLFAMIFMVIAIAGSWFGLGLIKTGCLIPLGWLFIGLLVRLRAPVGDYFLAVPILGWVWEKIFKPATFFEIDTQTMYRTAVDAAVHEVIKQTTNIQGIRDIGGQHTETAANTASSRGRDGGSLASAAFGRHR